LALKSQKTKILRLFAAGFPIIPSLQKEEQMPILLESRAKVVLVSSGSIFNIEECVQKLHQAEKIVFAHIDLIEGLGKDAAAVSFLKKKAEVDGIVSPNRLLIAAAQKEGLITVQRFFAHDSPSVETGLKVLKMAKPDFIEVLPGLMAIKVFSLLRQNLEQPIIAAGLVKTSEEVKLILNKGIVAVDTSTEALWNFEP
jgi:glycerol uptake operon antiterminator